MSVDPAIAPRPQNPQKDRTNDEEAEPYNRASGPPYASRCTGDSRAAQARAAIGAGPDSARCTVGA